MLLKCCVNGPRLASEHPGLPVTPDEIARAAADAREAGADAVHVHAKNPDGQDTLDATPVAEVLRAVRAACPGLPVGITTGAWAQPDPDVRRDDIASWRELPDFASVNWHEPGAEEVARQLLEQEVGVEAGLWNLDAVLAWLDSPLRDKHLRVLLELPDGLTEDDVRVTADELLARLSGRTDLPVLLHGAGSSAWPAYHYAVALGLDSRIGLEDTLELPDGTTARDNAALVHAARVMAGSLA
jgi:uncharacterized protein (DUF849 family)